MSRGLGSSEGAPARDDDDRGVQRTPTRSWRMADRGHLAYSMRHATRTIATCTRRTRVPLQTHRLETTIRRELAALDRRLGQLRAMSVSVS